MFSEKLTFAFESLQEVVFGFEDLLKIEVILACVISVEALGNSFSLSFPIKSTRVELDFLYM